MMPLLTILSLALFTAVTFGLRTWLQVRRTGATGFAGLRPGAGPLERIAGLAMVLAFALVPIAVWLGDPVLPSWTSALGLVLVAVGTGGTFAAQITMGNAWRIGVDPSARTELITAGMFRWVRNPIFTMMILVSIGLALACSTPLMLALPLLLVAALEVQVRVVEEPWLATTHGEAYRTWAAHTGRFVPGLGRMQG